MSNRSLSSRITLSALSVVTAGGTAEAATAAPETTLEEIVVTARGRMEAAIDVPYNISAVSGAAIEQNRIADTAELLRTVPGVVMADKGARNSSVVNQIIMRGVNMDGGAFGDYSVSTAAPVSTYYNNTPLFASFMLRDLERVEVLRGPQGTLYGSGSLGGTVRYILRDPTLDATTGSLRLGASHATGSGSAGWDGDFTLNVPLGSTFAVRAAVSTVQDPGIIDLPNAYRRGANGIPVGPGGDILSPDPVFDRLKDVDFYHATYARIALRWQPSDNLNFVLSHVYENDHSGGRRARTAGINGYGQAYGKYEMGSSMTEPYERSGQLTALEATVDLGFATLTSSSSYYDNHGVSISNNSGFYTHVFNDLGYWGFYFNYPRPEAAETRLFGDKAFAQELRLASRTGGRLDYVVGAFYERQQLLSTQDSQLTGFVQWCNVSPACLYRPYVYQDGSDFHYQRRETFTSNALFGELTLHATPTLDFTGGVRAFSDEDRNRTDQWAGVYTFYRLPQEARPAPTKHSKPLFKVNLAWRYTDNQMLYSTISQGYRRGGINAVPLSGFLAEDPRWGPYKADWVTNYEIGTKGTLANGITFDADVFYIDWKDPQINTASTQGFFATINGGKARTMGVEFLVDGHITPSTHYNVGYSFTRANLKENAVSPVGVIQAFEGDRLPSVPKHMLTASIDHTQTLSAGTTIYWRLAGYYQSDMRNSLGYTPPRVAVARFNTRLPGYSVFNTSVSLDRGPYDLTLYLKNIFNTAGVTAEFTNAYMGNSAHPGIDHYYNNDSKQYIIQPRTIGLSASWKF